MSLQNWKKREGKWDEETTSNIEYGGSLKVPEENTEETEVRGEIRDLQDCGLVLDWESMCNNSGIVSFRILRAKIHADTETVDHLNSLSKLSR